MHPIIPWAGGKRRLAKQLLPLIENTEHACYVEPFAGGAAILFARAEPARAEVLNDVHSELVTLYRVVRRLLIALGAPQCAHWQGDQAAEALARRWSNLAVVVEAPIPT